MKYILTLLIFTILSSCQQHIKKANRKGYWIAKDISSLDQITASNLVSSQIYLPLIQVKSEVSDSVKFYFSPDSLATIWVLNAFDSFNLKLNEDKETMINYDYDKNELIFRDRHRNRFYRYRKIDPIKEKQLLDKLESYFGKSIKN